MKLVVKRLIFEKRQQVHTPAQIGVASAIEVIAISVAIGIKIAVGRSRDNLLKPVCPARRGRFRRADRCLSAICTCIGIVSTCTKLS